MLKNSKNKKYFPELDIHISKLDNENTIEYYTILSTYIKKSDSAESEFRLRYFNSIDKSIDNSSYSSDFITESLIYNIKDFLSNVNEKSTKEQK